MLVFSIVLLLWTESALGQTTEPEYEYEYYYDDETTTLSSEAGLYEYDGNMLKYYFVLEHSHVDNNNYNHDYENNYKKAINYKT